MGTELIGRPGLAGLRAPSTRPAYGAASWLARQAARHPGRIAVVDGERSVSYRELDERVSRAAHALLGAGVGRLDRIATLTTNCLEFVELFFATARIGALLVPLNWRLAVAELEYQLADAGVRLLFVGPEHVGLADRLSAEDYDRVNIGSAYEALLAANPPSSPPESLQASFEDPHLILYTSGTTGHPKGAILTHGNTFWNCLNATEAVELSGADTTVTVLPTFHSGGIGLFTIPTLYCGGRVVLMRRFEPDRLLDTIAEYRASLVFGVPAIWLELLKRERFRQSELPSLRYVVSGGAPHPLSVIEAVAARGFVFLQGYGLTETAPIGTLMPAEDWARKVGTVGKAALHVELRVVDDAERDLPPGAIGEVLFRGPNVFAGYWGRPDATAEAFTADGWFRTGDLGWLDDEGFLTLVDRKKDMVITGGENVYSAEVEDVLFRHPAVADAAVIGVPDQRWGEAVFAVVVVRPEMSVTAAELIEHCGRSLARYKWPKGVAFVDELPRNASGKVLKRELRARFGGSEVP